MNDPTDREQSAEQRLEHALRELPSRRAPVTLEARVMRELARRAAQPWWLRTFAHWPAGARGAFAILGALLVVLGFLSGSWAVDAFGVLHDSGAWPASSTHQVLVTVTTLEQLWSVLASLVPSSWLGAALAAGTVLYVTLFALGALAYRLLYVGSLKERLGPLSGGLAPSNGR